MKESRKKKIIIIGGGISGLTAGIYALDNDFDVTIYEKHYIPGGQCTGWTRKNIEIDGCAHWIVGTNPKSDLFPLWKHIGAFNENTSYFQTEYFSKFDFDGKLITLWKDIYKLYAELVRLAPEDKKRIRQFIRWIKAY
jgi:phytoene dehydrogenase-like protein